MAAGPASRTAGWRPSRPRAPTGCHGPTGRSSALPCGRLGADVHRDRVAALSEQGVHFALESLEILEALVDAGEPDVGDLVDAAELLHGERPDPRRGHLGDAGGAELGLDRVGGRFGGAVRNGPPGQRLAQPRHEPVAIEFLARPVALDDDEPGGLDPLVRREPHGTRGALAAAADGRRIVEVARVDDAGLPLTALGAAHRSPVVSDHKGLWGRRTIPLEWVHLCSRTSRQTLPRPTFAASFALGSASASRAWRAI